MPFLEHAIAKVGGYFWLPCPNCRRMFGGHEKGGGMLPYTEPFEAPIVNGSMQIGIMPAGTTVCIEAFISDDFGLQSASMRRCWITCNHPDCLKEVRRKAI